MDSGYDLLFPMCNLWGGGNIGDRVFLQQGIEEFSGGSELDPNPAEQNVAAHNGKTFKLILNGFFWSSSLPFVFI